MSGKPAKASPQDSSAAADDPYQMIREFEPLIDQALEEATRDFRANATKLVRESGVPIAEIALQLGLPVDALELWVAQDDCVDDVESEQTSLARLRDALTLLREENARLRQENERLRSKDKSSS